MPALSQEDSAAHTAGLLHAAWEGEVARRGWRDASFFGAAHAAFGRYFWASAGYKLVNDVFIFVNPALINVIVGYANQRPFEKWDSFEESKFPSVSSTATRSSNTKKRSSKTYLFLHKLF